MNKTRNIIKFSKQSFCGHREDLKRPEEEINLLHKSVANLRKDIPTVILKMLTDRESRRLFSSA